MNNDEDILKGSVDRFFFQSIDTGFVVFILKAYQKEIVVQGTLPSLQIGQEVELSGGWENHPKFGRQFRAVRCIQKVPTSLIGLKKYLGSGLIKGIGKVYAEKMVSHFGETILSIIDTFPERLKEIPGIGTKRQEEIIHSWCSHRDVAELMAFLQEKGISTLFAAKIYKQYKGSALALIQENPYRLAEDVWGIGFRKADELAQKLGLPFDASRRIEAGIIFIVDTATKSGSLYCELDDLREKAIALLGLEEHGSKEALIKRALHVLYESEKIKLMSYEQKHYITSSRLYHTERSVARALLTLLETKSSHTLDATSLYTQLRAISSSDHIELNEDQQRGIMAALQNKVTVITGGPGTGKTTLIKKMITLLEKNNIRYKLAAPTGRAAKRILEGTGRQAATVHRLLEFNVASMSFTYNEKNRLDIDILIIDEVSMLDIFLAYSVIKALPYQAHLVLIGDRDQLPSVGPGNFLQDCIQSEIIACVRLSQIFRQAQNSMIVVNAHRINAGEFPLSILPDTKKDYYYISEESPEKVKEHLKKIFFIELSRHALSWDDCMVLVPMNKGSVGTQTINSYLQEILNPRNGGATVMFAGTLYKEHDRVMQIKNSYEKLVFNGDIGKIVEIAVEKKIVSVLFDQRIVEYDFSELSDIVLAYDILYKKSCGYP